MLPFTPISEELLPSSWINESYPLLETSLNRLNPPIEEQVSWFFFIFKSALYF